MINTHSVEFLPIKRTHINSPLFYSFVELNLSNTLKLISSKFCLLYYWHYHNIQYHLYLVNGILRILIKFQQMKFYRIYPSKVSFIFVIVPAFWFMRLTISLLSWVVIAWEKTWKASQNLAWVTCSAKKTTKTWRTLGSTCSPTFLLT